MDNQAPAIIELSQISKSFGELNVLKRIDLTLKSGDTVAILGPSGAGKSTLLHIAGLMERPTEGRIMLNGRNVTSMGEREKARERLDHIGFVFQFHYLLPEFDVLENVLMPARVAGDNLQECEAAARQILGRLGLKDRLAHKPNELSGGEQQRVALTRALIREPRLLLCDEPTGNLDQKTAEEVIRLIWLEVERNQGAAIIVTHNEALAKQAKRSYHLVQGQFR